jgi:hypothetical protein
VRTCALALSADAHTRANSVIGGFKLAEARALQ